MPLGMGQQFGCRASGEPMRFRDASGKARPKRVSVSPSSKDVYPIVWDEHGVGGEVEEEEEGTDEEEVGGEDPERIRLQEDSEAVKKIGDPMLPSDQE
eukprot:10438961-Karenia_brevis.AAC.1